MNARYVTIFTIVLVLSIGTSSTLAALAQTPSVLSVKGTISASDTFAGTVLWTIIYGDKGTLIAQSPIGRSLAHLSIKPSPNCSTPEPICLFANVTDTTNTDVIKVSDSARIAIDPDNKQETILPLKGFLAGAEFTVNLSKVWQHKTTEHMPLTNSTTSTNSTMTNTTG